jgi:transitional endoplasmic reticulum ATPase
MDGLGQPARSGSEVTLDNKPKGAFTDMTLTEASAAAPLKGWSILSEKYRSNQAHAFHFYGSGTFDYVTPGATLRQFIFEIVSPKFPTRLMYSPGRGLTFADEHSQQVVTDWFAKRGMDVDANILASVAPAQALPLILQFLADTEHGSAVAIVSRMDLCFSSDHTRAPSPELIDLMHECGTDKSLEASANILIMISPALESVHEGIRDASSGIVHIEVGLPDPAERFEYIHEAVRIKNNVLHADPVIKLDMSEQALADATSGLTRRNIEDILLGGNRAGSVAWPMVNSRSAEIISAEAAGLLKVVKPERGFEYLGGMRHYKSYADKWVIGAAHSEQPSRRKSMPMVMLFAGPPGTGKTDAAYATAKELGWNCLEMEQIKNALVGETERNMAKALSIVRSKLPAVLFLDEADQMFGRVTGGSGGGGESVDKAIFRSLLILLNDKSLRGDLLIILNTNVPGALDGAVLDRCDVIVPFLPAESAEARADILSRMYARRGIDQPMHSLLLVGAMLDNRWSGRDMDGLVTKAYGLVQLDGLKPVEALEIAAKSRRPQQREDARLMTEWAIAYTNDLDLLPEEYRQRDVDKTALDREIAQTQGRSFGGTRDL